MKYYHNIYNNKDGFTLIETILAMTIIILVFTLVTGFTSTVLKIWRVQDDYTYRYQHGQVILERMVKDLRGADEIVDVDSQQITFRKDGTIKQYGIYNNSGNLLILGFKEADTAGGLTGKDWRPVLNDVNRFNLSKNSRLVKIEIILNSKKNDIVLSSFINLRKE